jgi:AcrR family transcriptional regulator
VAAVLDVEIAPAVPAPDLAARAIEATLACIASSGLTRLTVDDVARVAGVSRATVYRAFPSKAALIAAALAAETDRIVAAVVGAAGAASNLDDAVARVLRVGLRELRASAALAYVAEHEAALLHPHLEFAGGDRLLDVVGRRLRPALVPWCADPDRAGEWVARIGLCLWRSPTPLVDPTDDVALGRFVTTYVTPGLGAMSRPGREEE